MFSQQIVSLARWSSAVLDIIAGLCLGIPALRFSRLQRSVEMLEQSQPRSQDLNSVRDLFTKRARQDLVRWHRRDHLMLWAGVIAFCVSSLIKFASLALF